jgi:hypothetical protein
MFALKSKLSALKAQIKSNRTKIDNFNQEQADVIAVSFKDCRSFANHLRDEDENTQEAIELLNKVFKLDALQLIPMSKQIRIETAIASSPSARRAQFKKDAQALGQQHLF